MARRRTRSSHHLASLQFWKTLGWHVSGKDKPRLDLWRRRLFGSLPVLGLLFHPDLLSRRGIHPSLREPVRLCTHPAHPTLAARRPPPFGVHRPDGAERHVSAKANPLR